MATIGIRYILQQGALSFYGPDARPVEPPFNCRIAVPWFGYSGYKLAVIAAAALLLLALAAADPHPDRAGDAGDAVRPRDRARFRHRSTGSMPGLRARRQAGGGRRGAGRADPARRIT